MRLCLLEDLAKEVRATQSQAHLKSIMVNATRKMGFDHFALSYDQWSSDAAEANFLVHDYPEAWARVYVNFDLARSDPIRRAGERSFVGFRWRDLRHYVALTPRDRVMLTTGCDNGLVDGYTVPRHLPGFANGSCTFAIGRGGQLPSEMLPVAEAIGAEALAAAKRLVGISPPLPRAKLSDRQRDCVLWAARGKSAKQIACELGISPATVIQHLRVARERYDVNCSEALILCALFDGLIGFADVFRWWYSAAA